jgi:hypothetical protein
MGQNLTAPTGIKSIQRGTFYGSGSSSYTTTISAVNTAKTELRKLGFTQSTNSGAYISLSNSTTITVNCISTNSLTFSWEVTEFY